MKPKKRRNFVMAEAAKKTEAPQAEEAPAKGSKKKLIMFVAIGLVLVGAGVGGAMFFLKGEKKAEEHAEEPAKPVKQEAIYLQLKQMTVGLQTPGRQRFLQVSITVESRDKAAIDGVTTHMALIENKLNMLLGGEAFEELQTNEGRELMRQQVLAAIQEVLQQEIGQPGIEQVYFENFVMQ